ncbi:MULTISPECIES: PP2C family protein-serine/threonine phosphatase [Kitasatospora]|uniref:Serine/threonine-protein phosphatase n=1 Tax=Kitasatospora acidiphila TaxID=2567942 RepID=A0A540W7F2_9ACTN|nr:MULTISPECIES: PP2C family protein-serine/threonine phosphatase [Kitasatospora]MDH6145116.1 serine phosphatase RsbU (regulator of sigma subunit) [Kitasatospora sp. GP30]TQF04956.1 serine/threonine-protein phosphatase [Kitasatospora acidiphila]
MSRRRPASHPSADDLLTELGRLTAQALEQAELQQARVELAEALQRELLPSALPQLPGLRAAARYAPARHGLSIGGDWYDGFRLPDGSVAFSLGDVQGHDVEAAAFMGQVRVGLRAVATMAADPGEVLDRANDLLISLDSRLFATCSFLRYDPTNRDLAHARAGHVPPVWANTDGRWGHCTDEGGPPLGVLPGEKYPVTHHRLAGSGVFVLVTDGVIEGPAFPIEAGLDRVAAVLRARVADEPGELATELLRVADLTGHTDDAAVLVLRYDD